MWNSFANLGASDHPSVVLRLTPSDPDEGAPTSSAAFRADNLPPAINSLTSLDTNQNGAVDRVDVTFSEPIAKSSLGLASSAASHIPGM